MPLRDQKMEWSRRSFLKYVWVCLSAAGLLLIFSDISPVRSAVNESSEEETGRVSVKNEPKQIADSLLEKLSENSIEKIKFLNLSYDVHMQLRSQVKAKMSVILELKREGDYYTGEFSLTKPKGEDAWSRFVLYVFAEHTAEYKEMIKAIETRIIEKFHFKQGRFVTEEFKEILPKVKKYENQTGMKVYLDYRERRIKFWEDQTKEDFNMSMAYRDQVGPMTGFFNFLLFEEPEAEISIINALKRTEFVGTSKDVSPNREHIKFIFGSQVIRLQRNDTGRHVDYDNVIYFQDENYLDIIYGKNVYYALAKDVGSKVKVPYTIMLDGIISKKKQRDKEERIRRLMEKELGHEVFEEERRRIEAFEELAAKDVTVLLRRADVVLDNGNRGTFINK